MSETIYDVLIIGGGPAGLTAAQYASRAKLSALVLDKSSTAGALAYTHKIENYPGLPEPVSGKELLDIFRTQALGFGAEFVEDAQVVGVSLSAEIKEVFTMQASYKSKSVIVATGSMGRKPTIAGEGEFLGRGVSYCAICDCNFFRSKIVCVLGDSEEAVKEAGLLCRFASTVYLIAPGKQLKVSADHPALQAANLTVLLNTKVREIRGTDAVTGVQVADADGAERFIELEGVFVYIHGSRPIVDFLGEALELAEDGCVVTNLFMETNIPGVFAAGDVLCTEVRQVVLAAANGCMAALSAEKYVSHGAKLKSDWKKSK
jgi:thioredoxin reductase (NADPH)